MKKVLSFTMLIALFVLVGLSTMGLHSRPTTAAPVTEKAESRTVNEASQCGGECARCCACFCGDDPSCQNFCVHDPGLWSACWNPHPPLCKSAAPSYQATRKAGRNDASTIKANKGSHDVAKLQRQLR